MNWKMKQILVFLVTILMLLAMNGHAEGDVAGVMGMAVPLDELLHLKNSQGDDLNSLTIAVLKVDQTSARIECGQSVILTALAPAGSGVVVWSSSDSQIASVRGNTNGSATVVGVGAGTAKINCTLDDEMRTFTVIVDPPRTLRITDVEYPSKLRITGSGWKLRGGTISSCDDIKTLTSSITDQNGITIESAYTLVFDAGVKQYSIKGIDSHVPFSKLQTEGQYTWTLTATDENGRFVTINLPIKAVGAGETVVSNEPGMSSPLIDAQEKLNKSNAIEMQVGDKTNVNTSIVSTDEATNDLIWMSSNPSVASISSRGEITCVGAGSTTILCRMLGNPSFSSGFEMTVCEAVDADGNANTLDMNNGEDQPQPNGQNLLRNTTSFDGYASDAGSQPSILIDTDGSSIISWPAFEPLSWNEFYAREVAIPYTTVRDRTVTLSFWARSDDAESIANSDDYFLRAILNLVDPDTYDNRNFKIIGEISNPSTEWTKYSYTIPVTDELFNGDAWGTVGIDDRTLFGLTFQNHSICSMQVKQVKLELGDIATDWTPSPEDVQLSE